MSIQGSRRPVSISTSVALLLHVSRACPFPIVAMPWSSWSLSNVRQTLSLGYCFQSLTTMRLHLYVPASKLKTKC